MTIPLRNVAAARGHVAVLGCEFSPHFGPNPDLSSLLVTWQRQEDNRVVHSFYYNRDQLDIQDPAYRDRTALFGSELSKGNASLKLRNIQKSDEGLYLCTVSTSQGTNKATLKLDYGGKQTLFHHIMFVFCQKVEYFKISEEFEGTMSTGVLKLDR